MSECGTNDVIPFPGAAGCGAAPGLEVKGGEPGLAPNPAPGFAPILGCPDFESRLDAMEKEFSFRLALLERDHERELEEEMAAWVNAAPPPASQAVKTALPPASIPAWMPKELAYFLGAVLLVASSAVYAVGGRWLPWMKDAADWLLSLTPYRVVVDDTREREGRP